ncbi:MAG: tRNA adenosine(34) deaminase TadA [Planctomycetota bacterium]
MGTLKRPSRQMTGFLGGDRHEYYMAQALREAGVAFEEGEVPVGAVIVHEGRIIARAHNQRERLHDPTAHAEMIAITQAAEYLQAWRLTGCTMVVTLEPCAMCAGAMVLARMDRLIFGAFDPKAGACGSVLDVIREPKLNHHMEVISGILQDECGAILTEFFKARREEP